MADRDRFFRVRPAGQRNAEAMQRALAEGLRASWYPTEQQFTVISRKGVLYHPTVRAVGTLVQFGCTCEGGKSLAPTGVVPCKHAAAAAVYAQAADLIEFDGERWQLGDMGRRLIPTGQLRRPQPSLCTGCNGEIDWSHDGRPIERIGVYDAEGNPWHRGHIPHDRLTKEEA